MKEDEFGDGYKEKIVEQYKVFLQMIGGLEKRREMTNRFFLSMNIGLLAAFGLSAQLESALSIPYDLWKISLPAAGAIFSIIWLSNIRSYKKLAIAKWMIVQKIEERLPLRIHETEWEVLQDMKYRQLTFGEQLIPGIFLGVHTLLGIIVLVQQAIV